jgi:Cu(I)/Ag(I) efflux system membrane protein CusA/SilA
MIGGIFTSFLLELIVYPAIYEIWKWHFEVKPAIDEMGSGTISAESRNGA